MRKSKIVYSLNIDDIQTVALEDLSRNLTAEELKYVIDYLPGYIDWQQAISLVISEALHYPRKTRQ